MLQRNQMEQSILTLNQTKTRWADYYGAVLKEKYPEAAAWLIESYGSAIDNRNIDGKLKDIEIITDECLANRAVD